MRVRLVNLGISSSRVDGINKPSVKCAPKCKPSMEHNSRIACTVVGQARDAHFKHVLQLDDMFNVSTPSL